MAGLMKRKQKILIDYFDAIAEHRKVIDTKEYAKNRNILLKISAKDLIEKILFLQKQQYK